MIDVMMILLFFFMITSSYLNLDMVPALQKSADAPAAAVSATPPATLLIRINAQGQAQVAGKVLTTADLSTLIATRIAAVPLTPVVLFPSGAADLPSLITVMEAAIAAAAIRRESRHGDRLVPLGKAETSKTMPGDAQCYTRVGYMA